MSLNWESKFSSIVRETEANLAKVRQRLGNTRSSSSYDSSGLYIPKENFSGSYAVSHSPTSAYRYPSPSPTKNYENQTTSNSEPTPGLIALLNEKIEQQGTMLENMSKQIQSLVKERDQMKIQMQKYEDQMHSMEKRLNEKGVDLQTERKIEIWKREVKTELRELQTQLKYSRTGDDVYNEHVGPISRELRESKRMLQEENDSLRRDVETLKTKLLNHDVDLTSQQAETKDLGRRVEKLDKNIGSVHDSQRRQNRDLNDTLHSNQSTQVQLTQIRTEMAKLLGTITELENKRSIDFGHFNGDVDKLQNTDINMKKPFDGYISDLSLSDFDFSGTALPNNDPSFKLKSNITDFEVSPLSDIDMTIDLNDLDLSGTPSISSTELQSDLM